MKYPSQPGLLILLISVLGCGNPPATPPPDPGPGPNPGPLSSYVNRGGSFFGSGEGFNRFYTDSSWVATRTLYVSRTGNNSNAATNSQQNPAPVSAIPGLVEPGDKVIFLQSASPYTNVNIHLEPEKSGSYDAPVVFVAERDAGGGYGVHLECRNGSTNADSSCFNFEGSNYMAVEGFEMSGGFYGVRAVGLDYASTQHQQGIAVLNNKIHDQDKDPIFTGQSDWSVIEGNEAYNAGSGDGHGIYISNGSDWGIVRRNELYQNASSDLQINADPASTCDDVGLLYIDPACDGPAENGQGQGVSEYFVVIDNFLHHGDGQGPNFTSVRNSRVVHNIFGPYDRHNTSFWQETDNPNLGSSGNIIEDNLFVGNNSHLLQLVVYATGNTVRNNIFLALNMNGTGASSSINSLEIDGLSSAAFEGNMYIGGYLDGHIVQANEDDRDDYDPDWFTNNGFGRIHHPEDWTPSGTSPYGNFKSWEPPEF
ncbi:MAG: hypothetical protein V3V13_01415 [Paracoccaceae bacterium]